ncbi:MAG: maleylacetoacetate isomerase [Deltaproteobacteria bacterium]|nr:maleylacetoacetate isomerase [Deltaproteobacteria bacterium]
MKDVRLYGYWRSSCSWRARLVLGLKGVEYESVPVHLVKGEQQADGYSAKNPMQQVPTLEWTDDSGETRVMGQSLAMAVFLDRLIPEPPLVPTDPLAAARAWELAEIVNAGIQPLQNSATLKLVETLGGDRADHARGVIDKGLAAMERLAATLPGEGFLFDQAPSIVEVCLVPQLYNARRFGLDVAAYPRLLAAEEASASLPAFAAAHPDVQPDAPENPTP